jgi:hypothetical protein
MVQHATPSVHLAAAGCAAIVNYPLWKASTIAQSGFDVGAGGGMRGVLMRHLVALQPPYKGLVPVVAGLTWARATIFYGSARGKEALKAYGVQSDALATLLPPLVVAMAVQFVKMPLVRTSVMIQARIIFVVPRSRVAAAALDLFHHHHSALNPSARAPRRIRRVHTAASCRQCARL